MDGNARGDDNPGDAGFGAVSVASDREGGNASQANVLFVRYWHNERVPLVFPL